MFDKSKITSTRNCASASVMALSNDTSALSQILIHRHVDHVAYDHNVWYMNTSHRHAAADGVNEHLGCVKSGIPHTKFKRSLQSKMSK